MSPDILIVRHIDGYRILHGHLHLVSVMSMSDEILVEAKDEGKVKILKTATGLIVGQGDQCLPLLRN